MSKKIISVVLAVMLMISMISVAMVSVSAQVDADGRYVPGEGTETYRYYFYMPDDWTSEFTSEAGVYWWAGTDNCQALGEDTGAPWPGYGMHQGDVANVWYVDVPTDVTTIIFNNALDGTDPASESFDPALHEAATQTVDIACEYYDPGESENYPDGTENFDNMIWVPNSEPDTVDDYGQRKFGGEWYYYHGNGVYDFNKGETEDTTAATEATEATEETAATEATEVTEATEATEETTAAPTAAPAKSFTVTSTSNIADPVSKTYSEEDKTVTVTYYLKTAKKLLCGDWYLTYDPSILKVTKAKNVNEDGDVAIMPIIDARGGGVANLFYEANTVYGSFTSERLYDFTKGDLEDNVFVTVVFDIIGDYTQDTTVNLNVNIITAGVRVEDSETEAHVDQYDYIYNGDVKQLFKDEAQTLATLSEPAVPVETTVPTEVPTEPETTAPTEPETTVAPVKTFTVTSTSNIADPVSKTYSEEDKTVTVTYYLKTAKKLLCGDWYLTYDPSILKVTKAKNVNEDGDVAIMPIIDARGGGVANLFYEANTVYGSFTSERLYDFTKGDLEDNVFVTVVFDIIGDYTQDTTVNLNVNIITAGVRVEDSETEAHVDQYDYIYNGDVKQLFKDEAQTLATLSEPAPLPTEPETTEPTEPETTEPTEPETTAPTEPETTAPTEPETTEPTEPETTEPTEPETTAPTEPETTEPTEPETTVPTEPETTEPTEPETTAPTEPETTVPAKSFTVAATSNYASTEYRVYKENVDKTVTVTYYLKADQIIGAGEAVLTYDPSILKVADTSKSVMPYVDLVAGSVTNFNYDVNQIYGSFTNVPAGYDFKSEQVLFTVTFDIVGDYTTDTVVDLTIMNLVAVTGTSAEDYDLVDYIIDGVPTDLFKTEGSGRVEFVGGEVPPVTEPETTVPTEPETTVPTEPETTVPTEPETTAPTEPETTAPTEPETTVPTEPETTAPTEPETTVPTEPETTAPVEPETTAPTEPDTTAPVEPDTTAPATTEPASVAPTTVPGATSTVSTPDTPNATSATGTTTGNGTVKTSDSPVAVMLLVLLAAATGFIIVVRKRELDK